MPKLAIGALVTKGDEDRLRSAYEILDEVKQHVEGMGLPPYPKPTTAPQPLDTVDLETLPNNQLGQLYAKYTAYAQYVGQQLAEAEAAYKLGVSALKMLEAKLKTRLFGEGKPKVEVPALVRDNEVFVEGELEVLKLYAMKAILDAHYTAYDKQAAALSRIVEIRKLEFEKEIRDAGIRKPRADRPKGNFGG